MMKKYAFSFVFNRNFQKMKVDQAAPVFCNQINVTAPSHAEEINK